MEWKRLLDDLRSRPHETEWFEFKINNAQPSLIGEYLSALSNSACLHDRQHGYLVYGIEDKTHKVVGTTFAPSDTKGKGNQGLEPWLALRLSPRIDFRIIETEYEGRPVVIFRVDATINTPVKFQNEAYIRVGEHKHKLINHLEKERKIWNKAMRRAGFELEPALTNQDSDDVLGKIDYPGFFDLLELPLPDNRSGILNKLDEEKIIQSRGSKYTITNLGGILFAKQLSFFPHLERKSVRVVLYQKNDRLDAIKEQTGTLGYAVGFQRMIEWIWDQLPAGEIIKEALRVEQKPYPNVAIREFVANAIIHQDFSIPGSSPLIEIFQSRMEITNPGSSLVSTDRFIDHAPRSRNELLASLMRRMNICEERGSGIDRAVTTIENLHLPAPEFQSEDSFTRVILFAHREWKDMSIEDRRRACYQHCCLQWVCRDFMTNKSLRNRFGIEKNNYPMASRVIQDAIEKNLIKLADPDKKGTNQKYIPIWA